jgi:ABC-2 type transport system ATP-binding protein/lipopolysaccharide transport system ATP-binding protein
MGESLDSLAIDMRDVAVCYRVPHERIPSFKEFAIRWLRRRIHYQDFWALNGVSLEVRRGEVLGIIGANGAGKSTLLKVVARVLRPTRGRVRVWGRVAPLLELAAGFDYELTGRENVFLSSAIHGCGRANTAARFDRIVDFAGVREFIDAPLRTYSSGMVARLGFSIATDVEPEILILDEILAVGDTVFQEKSAQRIAQFRDRGTAILLVTHDLEKISSMCDRVAWLRRGELIAFGATEEVVSRCAKEGI